MPAPLWPNLPVGLAEISAQLQKVLGTDLEKYLQLLTFRQAAPSFKVINDPIWYTIRVESWELTVLDSPVVQRLRNIRQLGLAGLVYPAAGYSRFEHVVGVLYQTQRIIESINRNTRAYNARSHLAIPDPVSQRDEVLLRLAAILHDIGHCFLSHVSERSLNRLEVAPGISMDNARKDAKAHFGCSKIPAVGELLSALIVLLPEFVEILKAAKIPHWQGNELDLAGSLAQLIVRGKFIDRPFMNEIISGAVDADKLDYMSRDCYMAGLAMPIDVERLLEKLCVVNVPAEQLQDYMQILNVSPNRTIQVLAVQPGGAKVFEDMVLSRVLLYDKLYNHQKIRAMESAVVSALDLLQASHPDFRKLSTFFSLSEAQFLELKWPSAPNDTDSRIEQARQIVREVKNRNFVRAFAFGPELASDPETQLPIDDKKLALLWRSFRRVVDRYISSESVAFRAEITERAQSYLKTTGQPRFAEDLHESFIVVDLPDVQGIAEKTKFFVGDENSGVQLFNERFRVEKWAEAYENQKITGYVFSPSHVALAVHVAFRDLVREKFKLSFEPWSWQLAKLSIRELNRFTTELIGRNVNTQPAPIPPRLATRDAYLASTQAKGLVVDRFGNTLDELNDRFGSYQSFTGEKVTRHRIREWLLQFDSEEIPLAINLLQHIRYWDRAAIKSAFSIGLQHLRNDLIEAQWVPLGGSTTSSLHLNYLWPDLQLGSKRPRHILSSAEQLQDGKAVVFYDDNIGSGGQSRTILQQWFGVDRADWIVNEEHVQKLTPNKLEVLRRMEVNFFFATGRSRGLRALFRTAAELVGHRNVRGKISIPDEVSCFETAAGVFGSSVDAEKAAVAFRKTGTRALADKVESWGTVKLNERLLGYGNLGGLNVFYYNVPSATVTALWKSCNFAGSEWMGLFPRRPRE